MTDSEVWDDVAVRLRRINAKLDGIDAELMVLMADAMLMRVNLDRPPKEYVDAETR
jgi:hypothetical protein